jgi:hypothetical protein
MTCYLDLKRLACCVFAIDTCAKDWTFAPRTFNLNENGIRDGNRIAESNAGAAKYVVDGVFRRWFDLV